MIQGWRGKQKGLFQSLWEHGWIYPLWLQDYSVGGKTDFLGVKQMRFIWIYLEVFDGYLYQFCWGGVTAAVKWGESALLLTGNLNVTVKTYLAKEKQSIIWNHSARMLITRSINRCKGKKLLKESTRIHLFLPCSDDGTTQWERARRDHQQWQLFSTSKNRSTGKKLRLTTAH